LRQSHSYKCEAILLTAEASLAARLFGIRQVDSVPFVLNNYNEGFVPFAAAFVSWFDLQPVH